jgi:ribosomal protein L37E
MDELISRQQAIDALRKLREEDIEDYGCEIPEGFNQDHLDRATFAIKQLPPIQPKRGRWVLVCDNNGMHFVCNKCGAWRYHQEQKFCGECGTDMRGKR